MTGTAASGIESFPPPLRQRQRDATRTIILRAAADLVATRSIHEFTIQAVADRAGVSHRSIYRYFPTREALIEGLYGFAEDLLGPELIDTAPAVLDEVPLSIKILELFDREPNVIRAYVIARLTTGYQPRARIRRTKTFETQFRRRFGSLGRGESLRIFAVLRLLLSSYAWLILGEDFGLSGKESSKAISWALDLLLRDVKRRNATAARRKGGGERRGRRRN